MLRQALRVPRAERQASNLDIVVIPALGLSQLSDWVDASGTSWLQQLVEDAVPRADIWEYVYSSSRQGSLAQRLLLEGPILLQALYSKFTQVEHGKLPVTFICHGTGAFVLKKALCICREQHFQYRPVIDVVAGAIFLGAPHFVMNKNEAKRTFDLMSKCQNKGIGRSLSSDQDVDDLTAICKSFELLNLNVPVLSAYESKETSTHRTLFSKFGSKGRNQIIVTKSLGTLGAKTETALDSESNHIDICKVRIGSSLYKASEELLTKVMNMAPQRITEASQPYSIPIGLKDDTLRSLSTAGHTKLEEQILEGISIPMVSRQGSLQTSSPWGGATGGTTEGSFEIVPPVSALEPTPKDPTLPCFWLGSHRRMDQFLGRGEVLDIIDAHLLPSSAGPASQVEDPLVAESGEQLRSYAICGLGGMGKTELAVEYAYSRREAFEAIFWLGADDARILASNFAQISQQLGLDDDGSDFAASRDIAMRWLSCSLKKESDPDTPENLVKWLIIFDNVDNFDVLSDYWPRFGRGSVLVTSRDSFSPCNLFVEKGMNLPPLSRSESESLMQRLTLVKADVSQKAALSMIAEKLDGLPLAINQMSAVFRRLRLSYTEFLNFYNEEGIEQVFQKATGMTESQNSRSLVTVWALDQLSPKTKALLQVMCLLDPDDIPEGVLVYKSGEVKLGDYPKTRGDYFDARKELLSSSLINQNADQEKLSLHRLIQDTTRTTMDEQELIEAFQVAMNLLISAWPFQSMKEHHSIARFSKCEAIFPSVLRLKNKLESLLQDSINFPLNIRYARLFNDVGWYMFERGLPEDTKTFCDLGLLIGERLKDSLCEEVVESIRESHSFIGIALVETNEHSLSMWHKKKWLDMLLERQSDGIRVEDYELGYAYNEIGVAYGNTDMLHEAADAFHRSIEIFQKLKDYEDTMLGWPEPNLGFIYWMQGKLEDAEHALVEILDIHAAAWGVDDIKSFKTGKILYGLGNVLESQGRFEESLGFHRRCLEQFKKVLGVNHHRFGDICHKMAGHYMRQGLYQEAESYLASSLKIFNSRSYLLNERARTTFRKGRLYELMGMKTEADILMSEACKMWKQLKPKDTRSVGKPEETDFDNLVAFWSR